MFKTLWTCVDYASHMAHFGHDDYTLNVPYGVLHLLKVKIN
jgi:hypothetical protein